MSGIRKKNILICPLDWGLGHATRCVPIINELLDQHCNVIIAADNRPLALLEKEFPNLQFIKLGGYNIKYPSNGSMVWRMLLSIPKIIIGVIREHAALDKIINEYDIDAVISDNRYGMWSNNIPSIFVTHQLNIKSPFGSSLIRKINDGHISKFDECWIPDNELNINLSGELSHDRKPKFSTYYIGPLSRFKGKTSENSCKYDLGIVLSGPEPQRSIFENLLLAQVKDLKLSVLMVRGITEAADNLKSASGLEIINHLPAKQLQEAIENCELIVCRPGYSSLMDLAALGKKAILVPTPGQTEQEYLAQYHKGSETYYSAGQKGFNLKKAIEESGRYKGIFLNNDLSVLKSRIKKVLSNVNAT